MKSRLDYITEFRETCIRDYSIYHVSNIFEVDMPLEKWPAFHLKRNKEDETVLVFAKRDGTIFTESKDGELRIINKTNNLISSAS
jgi:hypothetical protein